MRVIERAVRIGAAGVELEGALANLPDPELPGVARKGVVIFAHGSGSSRKSPRNQFVAGVLHDHGFVTLLLDLLADEEQYIISKRFDISLLATRLAEAVRWARSYPAISSLPIGLFGASTGAAAALRVAAVSDGGVRAVVSRGGRTDMTGSLRSQVRAPTLLVVGSEDHDVLALNQRSFDQLNCEKRLAVVPGATHLFEEQGALADVAHLAAYWFKAHLTSESLEAQPGAV
ncbi:MAG: dienelactone hydrolase family protein [Pseudomonadota bacterium]